MAEQAESSAMAESMEMLRAMRVSDCIYDERADGSTQAIPRSITGEANGGTTTPGKGKERAQDATYDFNDEQDRLEDLGLDPPRRREVVQGVTMFCRARQTPPINDQGKFLFCVDFDENCTVEDVKFVNSILINVSFKGCRLTNTAFMHVFLQDMEFIGCNFDVFTWRKGKELNQTWVDRHLFGVKEERFCSPEVMELDWVKRMQSEQVVQWSETPDPSLWPEEEDVPIHQNAARSSSSAMQAPNTHDDQDGEPGNFDFRRLGNTALESYNGPLDEETRLRRLAEWETFGEQQEKEREMEKRQQREAEQTQASFQHAFDETGQTGHEPVAASSSTASHHMTDEAEHPQRDPFVGLLSAVKTNRQPSQATGRRPLPHLLDIFRPATTSASTSGRGEQEDDLEEPVYRPASRFGR